jgi:hypothetical protein
MGLSEGMGSGEHVGENRGGEFALADIIDQLAFAWIWTYT